MDDERAIRLTLPAILEQQGFAVSVAASVPEALDCMKRESFDILLTDLNIGAPADGFILVSAMRRIQPHAATFILTGYPDFQTALEAIRKQVDDYFVKPADIPAMVAILREKAAHPRRAVPTPCKQAWMVIKENAGEIVRRWIREVEADPRLNSLPLPMEARVDRLPLLINDLAHALESGATQVPQESLKTAAVHGHARAQQGYTIPLLVAETRILHRMIAAVLQENLMSIDLSSVIPEALNLGEYLQALLEESIRTFEVDRPLRQLPRNTTRPEHTRGKRAKAG
ncbi:MAG TPA: response regulator [Terriglobales bacterium]|nr:response regulator [Terriglobales bacterium]